MTDPYEDPNPAADLPGFLAPDEPTIDQATVDALAETPSNVDAQGRAHFGVIYPDGEERCGGCNNRWPCDDATHLLVLPNEALE